MDIKIFKDLLTSYQSFSLYAQKAFSKKSSEHPHNLNIDHYLKVFQSLGVYSYIIADSRYLKIADVGGSVEVMTGYPPSYFIGKGYSVILRIHNLKELLKIIKGGSKYFDYFYSQPTASRPFIKVNYTFQLTRKNGTDYQALAQSIPIVFNEKMQPIYFLHILTDISSIKHDKVFQHFIIDSSDANNIKNIPIIVSENKQLEKEVISPAEKRVLLLIAEGKSSKQIAGMLFISENTVKNHRKHMLHKMDCNTSSELMKKCMMKGYI